jgi:hypothetical protein
MLSKIWHAIENKNKQQDKVQAIMLYDEIVNCFQKAPRPRAFVVKAFRGSK